MFFAQLKLQVWKLGLTSGTRVLRTLGNLFSSSVLHITSEWRENATFSLQSASLASLLEARPLNGAGDCDATSLLSITKSLPGLFVAQAFNRVELGGAGGGDSAENYADD